MKSRLRIFLCYIWITFACGLNKNISISKRPPPWYSRGKRFSMENIKELSCQKPNVYICEEPFGVISSSSSKQCNYRNIWYQEQVFRWVAGRGCLLYTPDFLFAAGVNSINLNAGCLFGDFFAPCLEIAKSNGECGCYPFDPTLEPVARAVRAALISAAHGRWERCFYEAADCCSHYMDTGNLDGSCEATFDGWTCWPKSKPETVAQEICSEFVYANSQPSCEHYSSKTCYSNGSWEIQTDYSSCSINSLLQTRYNFHIAALAVSVAACLPAVFIFSLYKKLRVGRVALHRNLLMAIIVRDVFVIFTKSEIYIEELTSSDDTVMSTNSLACRFLAFTERLAGNFVVSCMLIESIYMHKLVVATFRKKLSILMLYGFGAIITVIPTLIWALVMALINNHSCWLIYSIESIQWILDVPVIATILITAGLFIGVLKVLLDKIKNAENLRRLYTTKATLFILTLFGTHYLMTALRPSANSCVTDQLYFYIVFCVESLQGIAAAFLYCYYNGEVYSLLKTTYQKTESAVTTIMQRSTSGQSSEHISSSTEIVAHTNEDKQAYSAIGNKLHAAEVISIQASERLAEFLDPIYEIVDTRVLSDGYENLEADFINYPSAVRLRNAESQDFYGFTKASSISIECEDWIRCISSPSSSVFNNSLNDYEVKYLEMKFPSQARINQVLGEKSGLPPASKKSDSLSDGVNDKMEKDDDSLVVDGSTTDSYNVDHDHKAEVECIDKDCIVNRILKESIGRDNSVNYVTEMLSQTSNEDDNPFY